VASASVEDGASVARQVAALGGSCLLPGDSEFPSALARIPDPPAALFLLGDRSILRQPMTAVVGSRDHSNYGATVTRMVAGAAARAGLAVVSGMARGLDAEAHLGALDAGGATVGVLGNGLGIIYPAANRRLYERMAEEGLLLTEFPPGERPHAGSFPRRNRLISGLAAVTVVIEAAAGSGTLNTVEAALSQGRDVMAVPGAITSRTSVGTNRLIRDGAEPLLGPEDLLAHYRALADDDAPSPVTAPRPAPEVCGPDRAVLEAIGAAPAHVDAVVAALSRPVADVLDALCRLELAGLVAQHPGRVFVRRGQVGGCEGVAPAGRIHL